MVGLLDAPEELSTGDYICYPADQPHIFGYAGTGYPCASGRRTKLTKKRKIMFRLKLLLKNWVGP
jgi:hypothetical protein